MQPGNVPVMSITGKYLPWRRGRFSNYCNLDASSQWQHPTLCVQQTDIHSFIHPFRAMCEVLALCQALREWEGFQEEVILGLSEPWSAQTSVPVPQAKALHSEFLSFL